MSDVSQKLSVREKLGYSLGDAATNFFFMSMILYQGRFYTDTVGLSPASVGWMFILVRWMDAIVDPIVGTLSDRTQTRWGKFRPWVLWTALPFGVIFWLAYTAPHFGPTGNLIYAVITYVLLMMVYSANNTPYSALNGVMTGDASERTSVSTYRFVAAMAGQLLIQGLALPLVDKFGHGDSAKGWSVTIGIFSVACVIFYLIAFASTRERVVPDPAQKTSIRSDIADVFTCRPWVVMFLLTLSVFTTLALRGGSLNYYFNYYLDKGDIMTFLNRVGLTSVESSNLSWWKSTLDAFGLIVQPGGSNASSVGFSFFLMVGNLVTIPGVLISKPLSDRFGKKIVFMAGLGFTTLFTALVYLASSHSITLVFVLVAILWPLAYGPTVPLLWAMIADVADYSEWKNARRATGFAYAGILFALKAGLGLGGALGGWLLSYYGYIANADQSSQSLLGIRLSASIYAAIPFLCGVVCLYFYPIGKELTLRIQNELTERRKRYATA